MSRIAILGGGIAGLAAAYELELARKRGAAVDWQLFERSGRLGGTVETTRLAGDATNPGDAEWILEGGPDAWVTDKPWARELAEELGLGDEILASEDAHKKTYVVLPDSRAERHLVPMPTRMRMMVPETLEALEGSPLFSAAAKQAYAEELARAGELKATSPLADPAYDESVAAFVLRHFGPEVLEKIGAPLLSGVFGGDTARLSARAVMAPFVAMEIEHGSLIAALEARARERGPKPPQPTFTTLRGGMGSLVEAIVTTLPAERLHLGTTAESLEGEANGGWRLVSRSMEAEGAPNSERFDVVLCALPVDGARALLAPVDADAALLIPADASSAVLATFCWPAETARTFALPEGFGFLVPQTAADKTHAVPEEPAYASAPAPHLLAATFTAQKFADRTPAGARAVRAFFGTGSAEHFADTPDADVAAIALRQLGALIGPLPAPEARLTTVRRWPRSLPQYEVGHPARMAELDARVAALPGIALLGNGYRGVGVPDLIRDARAAARRMLEG